MVDISTSTFMIKIFFQIILLILGFLLLNFNLEDLNNSKPVKYSKLSEILTVKKP